MRFTGDLDFSGRFEYCFIAMEKSFLSCHLDFTMIMHDRKYLMARVIPSFSDKRDVLNYLFIIFVSLCILPILINILIANKLAINSQYLSYFLPFTATEIWFLLMTKYFEEKLEMSQFGING